MYLFLKTMYSKENECLLTAQGAERVPVNPSVNARKGPSIHSELQGNKRLT